MNLVQVGRSVAVGKSKMMHKKQIEPKVMRLLKCVKEHPELYAPHCGFTTRTVKQTTWDQIAKASGFVKTEDAKCRWRGLLVYFRQILEAVAKKKLRRYIPNTGNPNDKFVQLSDWRYYEYMKFMEPYMNISTISDQKVKKHIECIPVNSRVQKQLEQISSSITITPIPAITKVDPIASTSTLSALNHEQQPVVFNTTDFRPIPTTSTASASCTTTPLHSAAVERNKNPIKLKIGEVVVEIQVDNKSKETLLSVKNQYQPGDAPNETNATTITTLPLKNQPAVKFDELSPNDQNLKSFFDAMLKSTQKLPIYHQERIKRKLLSSIRNNKNL